MHNDPESPTDYIVSQAVLHLQQDYAKSWLLEANKWEEMEIYKKVSRFLPDFNGQVHLDMGFGSGHFLGELYEQNPQRTLLGIDSNLIMLSRAIERMESRRIPAVALGEMGMNTALLARERKVCFEPRIPEELTVFSQIVQVRSSILLLLDDIRAPRVLNRLLGSNPIDSASFMFPGVGGYIALEDVPVGQLTDDDQYPILFKKMALIRKSAVDLATEKVRENGHLLWVERTASIRASTPLDERESVMSEFTDRNKDLVETIEACWEIDDALSIPIDKKKISKKLNWGADKLKEENEDDHRLSVTRLRRNAHSFKL